MNVFVNTGKSENFKPIERTEDGKYLVSWNKREILTEEKILKNSRYVSTGRMIPTGSAFWNSCVFSYKPNANDIYNKVVEYVNNSVNYKIVNNFVWSGYSVHLDSENQQNYKAAFDLAVQTNGENLPLKFKFSKRGKTEYYTFTNLDTLKDFYLKLNKHINDCLSEGWEIKDSFRKEDYII